MSSPSHLRSVVLGGRGMLGADLVEALGRRADLGEIVVGDLPEVDITLEKPLRDFLENARAQIIFNCAAFTDVDGCESERELAFAVNAEGAGNVAKLAASLKARLVHVSTDFVFDGKKGAPYTEEDAPNPQSTYGASKLEGERLVAAVGENWAIARTAWLYGRGRKNFVDRILRMARERAELAGVTNQVGSPTWTWDLAEALAALALSGAQGIFHAANAGGCSRYEMVKAIVDFAAIGVHVWPADSSAFPRPAAVPAYSVLNVEKLRRGGHIMRPWQEALRAYVLTDSPFRQGATSAPPG